MSRQTLKDQRAWPLAVLACFANLAHAGAPYGGAFGAMPVEQSRDETTTTAPADSLEQATAIAALAELGSFPLKVHNGDASSKFWPAGAADAFVPRPVAGTYKVGACAFGIKTGAFSARQYGTSPKGRFIVTLDALSPGTTLVGKANGPAYVSVTSELFASPADGFKGACKGLLKDTRRRVGFLDLNETTLELATMNDQRLPSATVRAAVGTHLFIAWDTATDSIRLETQAGLAPSIESPIFALQAETADDHYLLVTPKLTMKKKNGGVPASKLAH